jgi:hypothetical protein
MDSMKDAMRAKRLLALGSVKSCRPEILFSTKLQVQQKDYLKKMK